MFNMSLIIFKPNVVRYVYHGKCIICFNLSCQAEHTKINSQLNFNPGLAPTAFWTTRPWGQLFKRRLS